MPCPYSVCSAVLPTLFTKELSNEEATEGKSVSLRCELNKAAANVEWKKGLKTLKSSDKYKMKREGIIAELLIQNLDMTDAGNYSCVCGDQQTMAVLTVHGKESRQMLQLTAVFSLSTWTTDTSLPCHILPLPGLHPQLHGVSDVFLLAPIWLCMAREGCQGMSLGRRQATRIAATNLLRIDILVFPLPNQSSESPLCSITLSSIKRTTTWCVQGFIKLRLVRLFPEILFPLYFPGILK